MSSAGSSTSKLIATGPAGRHHVLEIDIHWDSNHIAVKIQYLSGSLQLPPGQQVADWGADYEEPLPGLDLGYLDIGQGRRDILVEELRGIGLGSFLMSVLIDWAHSKANVPVATIQLSADDALTRMARSRRNHFWEKLGFHFSYEDGESWGRSRDMLSQDLVSPGYKLAQGWKLEEL